MRVFVLIHEYPPIGGGGGRVAQDICEGLARRGYEITVLTSHMKGLPRRDVSGGVQVIRLPSLRRQAYRADLISMAAYVLAGAWGGWRWMRQWRPELVHVHFAVPAGALAWLLGRLRHTPYVLTAHLGDVPGGVPEKTNRWFRWIYPFTPAIWKNAAQVVAVSEHTRQLAQRHYPVEIEVIPNGVDLSGLDPGGIRAGNPPCVVFAGRFVPQKNPLRVVETLARLPELAWKCVLIGDGPLRPEVEAAIERSRLSERFTLTGWIQPDEVIHWYRQCDLLFMPSLSEGFPVAGVQALAMGLAILASPVGGFIDLVRPGENGYLVTSEDEEGFVQALREMLSDKTHLEELRQNSRKRAVQFDLNRVLDRYERVYQAAIAPRALQR